MEGGWARVVAYHCVAVGVAARGTPAREEEGEGHDEGDAVAEDVVAQLQRFQLLGVVFAEQGQVDVEGHGEVPEGVGGDKPVPSSINEPSPPPPPPPVHANRSRGVGR